MPVKTRKLRPIDPLWLYLTEDREALHPKIAKLCDELQDQTKPENVVTTAKHYASELAAATKLTDFEPEHYDMFQALGRATGHALARHPQYVDKLNPQALARSLVEEAERETVDSHGYTDVAPDLFDYDGVVVPGLREGLSVPFQGEPKNNLGDDYTKLAVERVKQAVDEKQERMRAIGAPVHSADLVLAERLFALLEDETTATSDEAANLVAKLKYGSPHVAQRYLELASERYGKATVTKWERTSQEDRITKLRELLDDADMPVGAKALAILEAHGSYFRDNSDESYVSTYDGGVSQTYKVDSSAFIDWVVSLHMEYLKTPPSKSGLEKAKLAARSLSVQAVQRREVFTRAATFGGKNYVDLADGQGRVVEIDADGWRVVNSPPAPFFRPSGMSPLPMPEAGGDISLLQRFVNVPSTLDLVSCVAWVVMAQQTASHNAMLAFIAASGTAKSTSHEALRKLVDPSKGNLRVAPAKQQDVLAAASNNHVVSYENLSRLNGDIQDLLCSVVTGGSYATREYYTTNSEAVFTFKRSVIVNGITNFVTRPDLMQRTLIIEPPVIDPKDRREDVEVKAEFEALYPQVFGAVLDIHVKALRLVPEVRGSVTNKPRMAAFAVMGEAVARAMGCNPGDWYAHYQGRTEEQSNDALDSSPVFEPLLTFVRVGKDWEGTATELSNALKTYAADHVEWYRTAKSFADALRRIEGEVLGYGVTVSRRRVNGISKIRVTYSPKSDRSKQSSEDRSMSNNANVVALSPKKARKSRSAKRQMEVQ